MKKILFYSGTALLFAAAALSGCSDGKDAASEKGAIQQMTDKAAKKAVDRIRSPMDNAKSAADQQQDRLKTMEKFSDAQ